MTAVYRTDTHATIPFFPPDVFDDDRALLLELVRRIGVAPEQRFVLGEHTRRFEDLLRESLGAADVVACASGTSALGLVLTALGVRPGDEVVVPAFGCAPLAASVVQLGATPVFADIHPHTMVAEPDEVERRITDRTRAIMPAHMFSVMADMPRFVEIAHRRGVRLVEDSAVAQGAALHGTPAGLWGEAGLYSFVQVKTLGTAGEGGVVVTRDAAVGRRVRMLRDHGRDPDRRFVHRIVGHSSRFDEIQAAFLTHQLAGLPERLERRAAIARYYTQRFSVLPPGRIVPPPPGRAGRCYYVYAVLAEQRDALREHLLQRGVHSHVYYPRPLPHQPAFAPFVAAHDRWPNAARAAARVLALPVYSHLSDAQVEHIADAVCAFAHP